jgi:ATP-dependent DNA helicase RecQ
MPRRDSPQLCFLQERMSASLLHINMARVELRKKAYVERLDAMIGYVRNKSTCRTVTLVNYFGEKDTIPCGVCDVCLQKDKPAFSSTDFKQLTAAVVAILEEEASLLTGLQNKLPQASRHHLLEVLEFLHSEGVVERRETGEYSKIRRSFL